MTNIWNILIPVGLASLAVAVAWGSIITRQKVIRDDIEKMKVGRDAFKKEYIAEKKEYMTEKEHAAACKIATLEMKEHVSVTMKETLEEFDRRKFQPAFERILKAINGEK